MTNYRLDFTADEINALYNAITAASRADADLASAADKLAWMTDFLAHPIEFADELSAMRVADDDQQLRLTLAHAQRDVAEWHHRALRESQRFPSAARSYRVALADLRSAQQQLGLTLTEPDSRLLH
jgi:hypothetical protein